MQALPNVTHGVHHGIVEDLPVGSRYGFRPASPEQSLPLAVPTRDVDDDGGQPLLLDPYGRAIDTARSGPSPASGWHRPSTGAPTHAWALQWRNTIIYEAHVRGQSMLHPDVPEELRGTYAGWPTRS